MTVKVEAEALDTSLTQRGSQWPGPSAVLMRAVEENEAAYGLNTIRARPVSLVQLRHAWRCLGGSGLRRRHATLRGNHADVLAEARSNAAPCAALTHDTHESRERHDTERGVSHK